MLIWGQNSTDARAGEFTDAGGIFQPFAGCGLNAQGQIAGVVHNQSITEDDHYDMLSYTPPPCGDGKAVIMGLSVTDAGFGVYTIPMNVVGQMPFSSANPMCTAKAPMPPGTGNMTAPMGMPTMPAGPVKVSAASSSVWRRSMLPRWTKAWKW
jgi:hypothetical protein